MTQVDLDALEAVDDSNGVVGDAGMRLVEIHHAACDAARSGPARLAERLVELALATDWEWFIDGPELAAMVAEPRRRFPRRRNLLARLSAAGW
jgi:hypothetical protein